MKLTPIVVIAVAVSLGLSACGSSGRTISDVYGATDSTALEVIVDVCDDAAEVVAEEADDIVSLSASAPRDLTTSGNACQTSVSVTLEAPVGDRQVIDAQTGEPLALLPPL